jgi:hypothetical protein
MGEATHVAALLLLFGVATADAQMTPPAAPAGAYQKLAPGHQKVARALFEAQTVPMTTTTTKAGSKPAVAASSTSSAASGPAPKPLTLDQIAAMKQQGSGWEHVFRQMRAQGLLTEKTIAQVMTRYNQSRPATSASIVTTGAARGSAPLAGASDNGSARGSAENYGRSGNLR